MRLDGKKAEFLRLHNEERIEHGAPALCVILSSRRPKPTPRTC
jgi:hypothetical protein